MYLASSFKIKTCDKTIPHENIQKHPHWIEMNLSEEEFDMHQMTLTCSDAPLDCPACRCENAHHLRWLGETWGTECCVCGTLTRAYAFHDCKLLPSSSGAALGTRSWQKEKTDFNDWQGETQPYGHCFTSRLKKVLFEAFVHIQLYQAKLGRDCEGYSP